MPDNKKNFNCNHKAVLQNLEIYEANIDKLSYKVTVNKMLAPLFYLSLNLTTQLMKTK